MKINTLIIGLLFVNAFSWASPNYPYKWRKDILFIQEQIFPSILSNNLPICDFKRRVWNPLQIRQSVNVQNEMELAKAITNNNSITINLKSDILLSGNSTSTKTKTGSLKALLNISKQKNIIINGEGHKLFDFSSPIKNAKLKRNRFLAPYSKEVNGNEAFITSNGQILQLSRSKTYQAKGWYIANPSKNLYGLILPDELRHIRISEEDHVYISFRVSFVRETYQVQSCSNGIILFVVNNKDSKTTSQSLRDLSPQTHFYLTNFEENGQGVIIKKGTLSYPSQYEKISQCEANYIFHLTGQTKIELNDLIIIGGMEYGIMNDASLRIHHSKMINSIFGGIYNTGTLFADHNQFEDIKTSATRTEHYPNLIKNHDPYMEVTDNQFTNIGHYSSNSYAVWSDATAYIAHNEFTNTNYGAIRIGKLNCKNNDVLPFNLVEHNYFHHTSDWIEKRKQLGFQDSGDIYITPNNGKAIVRYNTIINCGGLGKNIGIYGDDGAYNMEIYCNIILDTENFYDIDCRDCSKKGEPRWVIPSGNHLSTHNYIAYNISNGYLRMQENKNDGLKKTGCTFINNFILGNRSIKGDHITDLVNLRKKKKVDKAIIPVKNLNEILILIK